MKCNNCNSTDVVSENPYKTFSSKNNALNYVQSRVHNWEDYLNGFAEFHDVEDWTELKEVSLRGIADGLAESDRLLADGSSNPDAQY